MTRRVARPPLGPVLPLEDRTVPATAFALSNNTLIPFDTANPGAALAPIPVTNLGTNALVGIDFRPQNALLYGLGYDATPGTVQLFAISQRTGVATPVGTTGTFTNGRIGVDATTTFGFDFNPLADRIRVVTSNGQNFRMNPNTGAFVDADTGTGGTQMDGAINTGAAAADGAAYTNNAINPAFTTLYTLNAATNQLHVQAPPNNGTTQPGIPVTLGGAPLDFTAVTGFDIPAGVNAPGNDTAVAAGTGFAVMNVGANQTVLYALDLVSGAATILGPVGTANAPVQGLAVWNAVGGFPAVALATGNSLLIRFVTDAPGSNTFVPLPAPGAANGIDAGEVLVGIDYRPATGQLFGFGVNATANTGTLYILDPQNGSATAASATGAVAFQDAGGLAVDFPAPAVDGYGFDFNPIADRVRVTTTSGLNFRVNPVNGLPVDGNLGGPTAVPNINTDGAITGINGNLSTGVSGAAYTNSVGGTTVTTLYTLDPFGPQVQIQNDPNLGTQTAALPLTLNGAPLAFQPAGAELGIGFDIPAGIAAAASNTAVASGVGYATVRVAGIPGTQLLEIDLTTGVTTNLGSLNASVSANGLALGDAPVGTVSFAAATAGGAEGTTVTLTLNRTGGGTGAFTVTVLVGGTAANGTDFTVPTSVSFADGQASATLTVALLADAAADPGEAVTLTLANPTNLAVLGAITTATVTITDVPAPPPLNLPLDLAVGGTFDGRAAVFGTGPGGALATPAAYQTPADLFPGYAGAVRAATGDFNADGTEDVVLITANTTTIVPPNTLANPGPNEIVVGGYETRMAVVSGKDGAVLLPATVVYAGENFIFGGYVTAGDIDNDGRAEWVITPELRGGPRVQVLRLGTDGAVQVVANFFGIGDPSFRDGCRAALGDVNGDGVLDVFVTAAFNGGPRTALFDGADVLRATGEGRQPNKLRGDFFATPDGADAGRGGRAIAAADVDGDGRADLIVTGDFLLGGGNQVVIYSGADLADGNKFPGGAGAQAAAILADFTVSGFDGARLSTVAAIDADGDRRADLAVGSGFGVRRLKLYPGAGISGTTEPTAASDFDPFAGALNAGVFVG